MKYDVIIRTLRHVSVEARDRAEAELKAEGLTYLDETVISIGEKEEVEIGSEKEG